MHWGGAQTSDCQSKQEAVVAWTRTIKKEYNVGLYDIIENLVPEVKDGFIGTVTWQYEKGRDGDDSTASGLGSRKYAISPCGEFQSNSSKICSHSIPGNLLCWHYSWSGGTGRSPPLSVILWDSMVQWIYTQLGSTFLNAVSCARSGFSELIYKMQVTWTRLTGLYVRHLLQIH